MEMQDDRKEQLAYAASLNIGMKLGFVLLLASFVLYVFGFAAPHIPPEDLPNYWSMPAGEYLKAINLSPGWSWLRLASRGDFMNLLGITFLSAVTIVCYLRIVPILLKNKDTAYAIIAIVEILLLVLAASGLLAGMH